MVNNDDCNYDDDNNCGSWQQGQGVEHSLQYRLRHLCICLSQHSVFFNITMMWNRTFIEGECSLGTKFKSQSQNRFNDIF
jgi:hypothetical protein